MGHFVLAMSSISSGKQTDGGVLIWSAWRTGQWEIVLLWGNPSNAIQSGKSSPSACPCDLSCDHTLGSVVMMPKAAVIVLVLAEPPTSRKLAACPPSWCSMSMVAIASPAPFTENTRDVQNGCGGPTQQSQQQHYSNSHPVQKPSHTNEKQKTRRPEMTEHRNTGRGILRSIFPPNCSRPTTQVIHDIRRNAERIGFNFWAIRVGGSAGTLTASLLSVAWHHMRCMGRSV